jgi:dipeptidyl aminopeptidase/acylaminoacyl peptidase
LIHGRAPLLDSVQRNIIPRYRGKALAADVDRGFLHGYSQSIDTKICQAHQERTMISPLLIVASLLCIAPAADESSHPFSAHDMLAMERISDPRVSPDGSRIVFTVRTTDLEENKGRTDLWLVRADATGLRRLTSHPSNDHNPRWARDGRAVLFLSSRSGSSQVWRIPVDGGEAEQVTDLALDAGNLILSPDGKHMAFTMEVFPDCHSVEDTKARLDEEAERKSTGLIYDRVFIRHWDTWKDGRRSHLFVMPSTGKGEPVDVMGNMDADTPSKPFGGP